MLCVKRPCCVLDYVINTTKIEQLKTGTTFVNSETLVLNYFKKKKETITITSASHLSRNNKKFWTTVKPLFSHKSQSQNKAVLNEGERIIFNDVEVAETMNEFFVTVTDSLGISENFNDENATDGIADPVKKAAKKFQIILAF